MKSQGLGQTQMNVHSSNSNLSRCENHKAKEAKYFVLSEEERIFYCEKCAISLASQGFKVSKM